MCECTVNMELGGGGEIPVSAMETQVDDALRIERQFWRFSLEVGAHQTSADCNLLRIF
jgi:hypothetical protein